MSYITISCVLYSSFEKGLSAVYLDFKSTLAEYRGIVSFIKINNKILQILAKRKKKILTQKNQALNISYKSIRVCKYEIGNFFFWKRAEIVKLHKNTPAIYLLFSIYMNPKKYINNILFHLSHIFSIYDDASYF